MTDEAQRSFEFIDPTQLKSCLRGRAIALLGYLYSLQPPGLKIWDIYREFFVAFYYRI